MFYGSSMEKSSFFGSSALVNEIISDALQKFESGDVLPASEASSMSLLRGQDPIARSTSIAHIPGLREYRSFTDDVLKSFAERENSTRLDLSQETNESSLRLDCTNPFDGQIENQKLFSSSEEFMPAENFMDEFEKDEEQCREENLFKDNRPAPLECSSINQSPTKLIKKQVPSPEWAHTTPDLEFQSFFSSDGKQKLNRNSTMITQSDATLENVNPFDDSHRFPPSIFDPGLPYYLGVLLLGVSSTFELPPLSPSISSGSGVRVKSFVNQKEYPTMCTFVCTRQKFEITINAERTGEVTIDVQLTNQVSMKLKAVCTIPIFSLPGRVILPSNVPVTLLLEQRLPFCEPLNVKLKSRLSSPREMRLMPDMETVPIEVVASPSDSQIEVDIMVKDVLIAKACASLEVRKMKISIQSVGKDMESSIVIINNEEFPVEITLTDDLGYLSYEKYHRLHPQQKLVLKTKNFNIPLGKPERTAKFRMSMKSPIEVDLKSTCLHIIPATQNNLRPHLPRFVWLAEEETLFSMIDHQSNAESQWTDTVVIEPCPLIENYVKVSQPPGDPTKVLLRVTKPPRFLLGRLRFFRKGSDGQAVGSPYGYRYPFLVPGKPQLRWYTIALNAVSNVYQLPMNGNLKVTNVGQQDTFIVTQREGMVLNAGRSAELCIQEECKIFYGLEAWRKIVKSKISSNFDAVEEVAQSFSKPSRMMAVFVNEQRKTSSNLNISEVIPNDEQSLVRLYQLFESTIKCITLQNAAENNTFFVR